MLRALHTIFAATLESGNIIDLLLIKILLWFRVNENSNLNVSDSKPNLSAQNYADTETAGNQPNM